MKTSDMYFLFVVVEQPSANDFNTQKYPLSDFYGSVNDIHIYHT